MSSTCAMELIELRGAMPILVLLTIRQKGTAPVKPRI